MWYEKESLFPSQEVGRDGSIAVKGFPLSHPRKLGGIAALH